MSRTNFAKKKVCEDLVGLSGPFTKIARAMSTQWGVRIVPSGTECKTDGEVIHIPFTADLLPLERRQILHGMLDHEVCHVAEEQRHKEAGRVTPMWHFKNTKDKKLKFLINVFEDIRIEQRYEARYPGMAQNIRVMNVDAAKGWAEEHEDRAQKNFWATFGSAIILRARRLEDAWTYEGEIAEWMALVEEEIAESQRGGEWVDTAVDLANRVYEKVKDKKEEKEREEKERQKDKGDEEGEGGTGGDESEEQETPSREDSNDEEAPGELGDPDEDPEIEDFADQGRVDMSDYVIEDARNFDRYIPHPKSTAADTVATAAAHFGVQTYMDAKAEVASQINGLRGKQRMLIMSWRRRKVLTGLERGMVDDDALADVRMGERNAFADITKRRALNTAISGVVDCSGSTGRNTRPGDCSYYALRTAIALAESWSGLNIPNEWLGYTVHDFQDIGIMPEDLKGPFFCRPGLNHLVFKGFDEPLKAVRARFGEIQGHGSNVDGESLAWAGRRLAARPEERKIMVVLCDGMPATWNGCHVQGYDRIADFAKMQDHLRYVIRSLTSAGIEVIGIGCGTAEPAAYFNAKTGSKFVHISNVSTMAVDIFRVMKARITKGAA